MDFEIEWHDRLGSTNTAMRERFLQPGSIGDGLVIVAHEQTSGRGRQQRKWMTTPNANLCFSLYADTDVDLMQVPSLTMAAAVAITDMLLAKGIGAAPKWPNDVLVEDRKICGILSERVENGSRRGIIVGIGLNVNMTEEEAAAIDRPATSMLIETGQSHELPKVLADLLPQIEFWLDRWKAGGFAAIREVWTEKAGPIGKALTVHDGDMRKSGRLAGFGDHGELLLETEAGLETIWSGDVS